MALLAAMVVPAGAAHAGSGVLAFQLENATLAGGSPVDRNYVNGLALRWVSPPGAVADPLAAMARRMFGPGQTSWGIGLTQQMFTPRNTTARPPNPADRPYAGYLAATVSVIQTGRDQQTSLSLALGLVGPGAGAEGGQNGFHHLIGQSDNLGWGYQLHNEPTLELTAARIWRIRLPAARRWLPDGVSMDLLPQVSGGLGNVRIYADAGATLRLGSELDGDFGPTRLLPGPDGGAGFTAQRTGWYAFLGIDGAAVGHDIFLDGNDFRASPHVTHDRFVGEAEAGVVVFWHRWRFSYTEVVRSRSYHGQRGSPFNFGIISIAMRL